FDQRLSWHDCHGTNDMARMLRHLWASGLLLPRHHLLTLSAPEVSPDPGLPVGDAPTLAKASLDPNRGQGARDTLGRLVDLSHRSLDERLEGIGVLDGKIGQYLAVDLDPGPCQGVHEPCVGEAVLAHSRIDALDPKRAEGALLALAVAIGILHGLLDRLLGDANGILAPAGVAARPFDHLLVLGMGGNAAFDACHGVAPSAARFRWRFPASAVVGHVLLDDSGVAVAQHHGAARAAHKLGG